MGKKCFRLFIAKEVMQDATVLLLLRQDKPAFSVKTDIIQYFIVGSMVTDQTVTFQSICFLKMHIMKEHNIRMENYGKVSLLPIYNQIILTAL